MKRLDLVIFGATGATGRKAVEETARVAKRDGLTWAVAGRSRSKLDDLLVEVSSNLGTNVTGTKKIIAEVDDENSLQAMCSQAKVLINCCGPYRLYGEPVIKAAVENKTHYVDVTGEPEFINEMNVKYDVAAKEAGVYIVCACGVDCIPNDMGVVFLQQQFDGTLNSVESYITIDLPLENGGKPQGGYIHYGTWSSLVHSIDHSSSFKQLISLLFPQWNSKLTPKLRPAPFHKRDDKYCVLFPAADSAIVYRTQQHLSRAENKRPVQFWPYVAFGSFFNALLFVIGLTAMYFLCLFKINRRMALDYPGVFSLGHVKREGPTESVTQRTTFRVELHGEGWPRGADLSTKPSKKVVARVSGRNPGYGATVTFLVQSALTVLKEQYKMPGTGGVLTTGEAFYNTSYLKSLKGNDVKFEIVTSEPIKSVQDSRTATVRKENKH